MKREGTTVLRPWARGRQCSTDAVRRPAKTGYPTPTHEFVSVGTFLTAQARTCHVGYLLHGPGAARREGAIQRIRALMADHRVQARARGGGDGDDDG